MEHIKNSIFKVITKHGSGTGFLTQGSLIIITNYHVIKGSKVVAVEDQNKERFKAKVVMANPKVDLAFLLADGVNQAGEIILDESVAVDHLSKVLIGGFPFGMPFTITEGVVSATSQLMEGQHYLQTDAAVNPGNSGGPMFNQDGVLMAVTTSKFNDADNMGFGIKHTDLIDALNHYKDNAVGNTDFLLKCPSCDTFIDTPKKHCESCGASLDESIFNEEESDYLETFIEGHTLLNGLELDPVLTRSGSGWEFYYGSAQIRIFVYNKAYLYVTSPINGLPKQNIGTVLEHLLDDEMLKDKPFKFGVYNNEIFISYREHISAIYNDSFKHRVSENIIKTIKYADDEDNYLIDNYGCTPSIESKM